MKSVILAGGRGTRLYPVIKSLPKPMAPVDNRCFLEILVDALKRSGLQDFTFCVSYMEEKIKEYFGDGSRFGVQISYSTEEVPLGTGGAIGLLRQNLHSTFLVFNGDTYQELIIENCLKCHQDSGAIATIAVVEVADSSRYGRVLNANGYVRSFVEKGESGQGGVISSGVYVLEPEVFDYIPQGKVVSLEQEVFPALLHHGRPIAIYNGVRNFFDIGLPDDYYGFVDWIRACSHSGQESNLER